MLNTAMKADRGGSWIASLARNLSEGVHGSLELAHACRASRDFIEDAVHQAIRRVLTATPHLNGHSIRRGYALPALQRERSTESKKGGRYPEVDFAAIPYGTPDSPTLCIEAKLAGSSHAKPLNLIRDVCRLALASRAHPGSACLFILAGAHQDVARRLSQGPMGTAAPSGRRLLAYPPPMNSMGVFRLANGPRGAGVFPTSVVAELARELPLVPNTVRTSLYAPGYFNNREAPSAQGGPRAPRWEAAVWRVEWVN